MQLTWKMLMTILNPVSDDTLMQLSTREYSDNLALMEPVLKKLSLRTILETEMRAHSGVELARPLGSPVNFSKWKKIFLNPRQLFELPTPHFSDISSKTIIGPRAKKPLTLDIPIMITAMSNGGSLSEQMKIALAKGATIAGTATNTGESSLVESERNAAKLLIGQLNRGGWMSDPLKLRKLDAIEVQLGQGAWGGASEEIIPANIVSAYQRKIWDLKEGEDAIIHSRMPGIESSHDIVTLLNNLKTQFDVPIGIKIAATHFIEKELQIIAQTDVDYIVIDGSEGGTSSSYPTLEDDVGLPTLYALGRTVNWLEKNNLKNKYNLIIAGGLKTPGEFTKALALGADAVYIGTIALMAALHTQITKVIPETVPVQLALWNGSKASHLEIDNAANNLANFLRSCIIEMKYAVQSTGKKSIKDLNKEDLVTVDEKMAKLLGIAYAGNACQ